MNSKERIEVNDKNVPENAEKRTLQFFMINM